MNRINKNFNLIEVLISFVVIIFSLFILLSLFPLATKQTSVATNLNHIASFTQSLAAYIKQRPIDESGVISLNSFRNDSGSPKPEMDSKRDDYTKLKSSSFDDEDDIAFQTKIIPHDTQKGLFLISAFDEFDHDNDPKTDGKKTKLSEVEVRIWHSPVEVSSTFNGNTNWTSNPATFNDKSLQSTSTSTDIKFPTVTRLNVEFSWPLNREYDEREKKFLFLTINRLIDGN